MNTLREAVEEYVTIRRGLGTEFRLPAAALRRFVEFLEHEGADFVTIELALSWAQQPIQCRPSTWADRLDTVRRFAVWRSATDPRTQIPPRRLLPHRCRRNAPYIYTDEEVEQLMAEASRLSSPTGLRALTYATLFGLLAATGLRPGEGIALDVADVDLLGGVLAIRKTKFGKSRFVPIHESTRRALADYSERRDRLCPRRSTKVFFISERGTALYHEGVAYTFAKVSRVIGLRAPIGGRRKGCGPRLMDLRHRFATRKLIEWYRAGLDVEREMPKLATYLGHVHVRHTYWYIEAVPELLQLATERLSQRGQGVTS
jgi:site-specific recombinase XerD